MFRVFVVFESLAQIMICCEKLLFHDVKSINCTIMKTTIIYLIIALFSLGSFSELNAQYYKDRNDYHVSNAKKGLNLGADMNFGQDFYARNFHIGYGITDKFDSDRRAYWQIGADVNWTNYSIFNNYGFSYFNVSDTYTTTSVSFPFYLGYEVRRSMFSGLNVYAGPVYDFIITSRLNGQSFYEIDHGQWGFTIGTKIKFLAFFNAGVALKYFPNSLFDDGGLNRTSLSFSVGF